MPPRDRELAAAGELLAAAVTEGFHAYSVSTRVNSPMNDDAGCVAVAR